MTTPLYTAPTFQDGYPVPAVELQELADETERLSSIAVTAWTTYTPLWASTGTQPAVGNATVTGFYRYLAPDLAFCQGRIFLGSTSTVGTGVWLVGLPTDYHPAAEVVTVGECWLDNNGVASYPGACVPYSGSGDKVVLTVPGGGFAGPTTPFTWGTTDSFRWSLLYRPADT